MIEPDHKELSVREQCELLRLYRSTLYYRPRAVPQDNEALMRRVDELHTAHITWEVGRSVTLSVWRAGGSTGSAAGGN